MRMAVLIMISLVAMSCASSNEETSTAAAPTARVPTAIVEPSPAATAVPAPAGPKQISYGDLAGQYGWLDVPTTPPPADGYPVVILVHGGFWREPWDYTLMSPLTADLVDQGYATWNIEFRRVGGFGGYPETFDDVAEAIDTLATPAIGRADIDLTRVALIGHSSGGHLALWALGRSDAVVKPVGAIGLGAVADLDAFAESTGLLGGDRAEFPDRYAYADPELDPTRVVLIQGDDDRIVPTSTLAKARDQGTPIIEVANTDHFDLIDPTSEAWALTLTTLATMLP